MAWLCGELPLKLSHLRHQIHNNLRNVHSAIAGNLVRNLRGNGGSHDGA